MVKKKSKGEKMKFKKGDKVKIVSTKESGVECNFNIGDIYEIREQGQFHVDGKKSYTVFTKDKSNWWYMYEDGLEGVDELYENLEKLEERKKNDNEEDPWLKAAKKAYK